MIIPCIFLFCILRFLQPSLSGLKTNSVKLRVSVSRGFSNPIQAETAAVWVMQGLIQWAGYSICSVVSAQVSVLDMESVGILPVCVTMVSHYKQVVLKTTDKSDIWDGRLAEE